MGDRPRVETPQSSSAPPSSSGPASSVREATEGPREGPRRVTSDFHGGAARPAAHGRAPRGARVSAPAPSPASVGPPSPAGAERREPSDVLGPKGARAPALCPTPRPGWGRAGRRTPVVEPRTPSLVRPAHHPPRATPPPPPRRLGSPPAAGEYGGAPERRRRAKGGGRGWAWRSCRRVSPLPRPQVWSPGLRPGTQFYGLGERMVNAGKQVEVRPAITPGPSDFPCAGRWLPPQSGNLWVKRRRRVQCRERGGSGSLGAWRISKRNPVPGSSETDAVHVN